MNNYKLIIQYDGTNYSGWQIQENSNTVQQKITDAIEMILNEEINLIGSGRTDSGVHALGQAANFRTKADLDIYRFKYSLNSILPSDISITEMEIADENFHARFDAKKRSYIYLITKGKSPFYNKYSYHYHSELEVNCLNKLSRIFLGKHDFTSFCKKSTETENKICNIDTAQWKETKGFIVFLIEADRFLHGMVRTVVGTLLNGIKNKFNENHINDIFSAKERASASEAVPAKGLFLNKVKY